jgi:hypothetical protein
MTLEGTNSSVEIRWENRIRPNQPGYGSGLNWFNSPPYTESTGTNLLALAAAAGMPAVMKHGEVVNFRVGVNSINGKGPVVITSITNANPGEVMTQTPHGFSTGDVVIHGVAGMTNLNFYPVCVTVVDATHYTMQVFNRRTNTCTTSGVDTTSWRSLTTPGPIIGANRVQEYFSLNVGGRGNYPITFNDGFTPFGTYNELCGGQYVSYVFDKNSVAIYDDSGNPVHGAWIAGSAIPTGSACAGFAYTVPNYGIPIEIQVKLIDELNAMLPPGTAPIHMWVDLPHMGLQPQDPDYAPSSDYAINLVKTIINGANGYPGLCSGCELFVENSNETWNFGVGFLQTFYYARQGYLRWGGNTNDFATFATLRNIIAFEDIKNNSGAYSPSIIKFANMGGLPFGPPGIAGGGNNIRYFGSATLYADPLWPKECTPAYKCFDVFGYAPYVQADEGFYAKNLAKMAAQWAADAGNATAQEADAAVFVDGIENGCAYGKPCTGLGPSLSWYEGFNAAWMKTIRATGKSLVNYEGGGNWCDMSGGWGQCQACSTFVPGKGCTAYSNLTATEAAFLQAVYQSRAWGAALQKFFLTYQSDPQMGLPGLYLQVNACPYYPGPCPTNTDFRWAFASPDFYGTTSIEGGGLAPAWAALSEINAGKH